MPVIILSWQDNRYQSHTLFFGIYTEITDKEQPDYFNKLYDDIKNEMKKQDSADQVTSSHNVTKELQQLSIIFSTDTSTSSTNNKIWPSVRGRSILIKSITKNKQDEDDNASSETTLTYNILDQWDFNSIEVTAAKNQTTYNQSDGTTTFRKVSTTFGDTSWYGCTHKNETIVEIDCNDANIHWVYVYVQSNRSAFVRISDKFLQRKVHVGDRAVLPCRPTSPKFNVTLMMLHGHEFKPVVSNRTTFDPKFGFIIKNSKFSDIGSYSCEVNQDGFSQKLYFNLSVIKKNQKKPLIEASIGADGMKHVVAGSTLNIKCKVEITMDNPYNISWETPYNTSFRKIVKSVEDDRGLLKYVTSQLILNNVTFKDQGNYTCQVKSLLSEQESTNMFIKIYDPRKKYINLEREKKSREIAVEYGEPLTLVAHVDAYPKPTLKWSNFYNDEIVSGKDFVVSHNALTGSNLTIKKVVYRDTYTLQANNSAGVKSVDFRVKFYTHVKPYTVLYAPYTSTAFYVVNKNATFTCKSDGYPQPNITWFYEQCPTYNSDNGCKKIELKNAETDLQYEDRTHSKITVNITAFGRISCTACSRHFCNSDETSIRIIDEELLNGPVDIDKRTDDVVEGETVTVSCTIVHYLFPKVTWTKFNPYGTDKLMNIVWKNDTYIHRAVLEIKNVSISDQGHYFCEAWNENDEPEPYKLFKLEVRGPETPKFIHTNMNDTEQILSWKDALNTIVLLCKATGIPKPDITWYKDDKPLKLSKQFNLGLANVASDHSIRE
ncbi:vascular endothelial growth factor receptor 1-like [Copidosoma floridanum]|uniref:vascular endothelial growth factor receptor 1-like n=1 Tax=Copidosoma floridanum TaxID=29053 RepID=UPI000C6FA914|nr:vascular endothelial growth factor receptor 1-like [Copidosoma floridanum]